MSTYGNLLSQAAVEMRLCRTSSAEGAACDPAWIESISKRIEAASGIEDVEAQEREVTTISRMLLDSGPADTSASPAFWQVVDAIQRRSHRKR